MQADKKELNPSYNYREVEEKWYAFWEKEGFFTASVDAAKKPYTIVIPPPNVTGILHMGHALNNSIQDILIRWQRMKKAAALWIPGTDHAGIATQNVVEKKLRKEGKSRHDLGREAFIQQVWNWKQEYGSTIVKQLRRLGASCDWSRERFTMDEGLSRAVLETFIRLYEDGLIYQGSYIINWCPRCATALADEEAPHKELDGKLYYYHYLSKDPATGKLIKDEQIIVATTRPETMLGDTAVAVNPQDERYQDLQKREIYLPLQDRLLRVVKDDYVDAAFGSGVVKITPSHDPNDFEIGRRHGLEFRNIMTQDAKINENGAPYTGLDRFEARKKIIEDLKERGLFVKEEVMRHKVPHCYRCDSVIEPYISKQWFVKMKPLAEQALQAEREGKVKFYPARWTKVYEHWLENIRDWCISRQIWWGHRIPVWYDEEGNAYAARSAAEAQEKARAKRGKEVTLKQDEDVLDTWFSSWLWPFSTLGWPDKNQELAYFYPTATLVTGPDILFFWVARMIMAGLYFMKEVPFKDVYIHGTVRTDSGQKMSKSLGNAIDPLEVIEEIGADALRFSVIMLTASGQDAYLSKEKFELGRNFTNKIWNAARFALMNVGEYKVSLQNFAMPAASNVTGRWIVSRVQECVRNTTEALETFRFNDAAAELYHFFWSDFCDWYLEAIKLVFRGEDAAAKQETAGVLIYVFETFLRLLHPFMPYVTEEIWQRFNEQRSDKDISATIMRADWPVFNASLMDENARRQIELLQQAIVGIRDLKAKLNLQGNKTVPVVIKAEAKTAALLEEIRPLFLHLARIENLEISARYERGKDSVGKVYKDMEIFVRIAGLVDAEQERNKLSQQIVDTRKRVEDKEKRLANPAFAGKAPENVVEGEKKLLEELRALLASLEENLSLFSDL